MPPPGSDSRSELSPRLARWREAWESSDVERILDLYEESGRHSSRNVRRLVPEVRGVELRGKDKIREFLSRGLHWYHGVRFEILSAVEVGPYSFVEYRQHSPVESGEPRHVLERIEWRRERIKATRLFEL